MTSPYDDTHCAFVVFEDGGTCRTVIRGRSADGQFIRTDFGTFRADDLTWICDDAVSLRLREHRPAVGGRKA